MTQSTTHSILHRLGRMLRMMITVFTNAYLVFVAIFLALRFFSPVEPWWLAFLNNFTPFYFVGALILMIVALLIGAQWTALRALPFVLIGLVWFGPLYLPKTATVSASNDNGGIIQVSTFNILNNGRPFDETMRWFETRKQTDDIIIMQEVNRRFPYMNLGYWDHRRSTWGTWLYTLHKVVKTETLTYAGHRHQRVVIDVDGQQIAVYGVHLLNPFDRPRVNIPTFLGAVFNYWSSYDETIRNQQVDELLARLESETLPYIVAGDFNLSDYSRKYNDLAAAMHDSFREAGTGLGTSWPMRRIYGIQPTPPLIRIDYIFHSDHFDTLSAALGDFAESDHLPLHATLRLNTLP